MPFYLGYLLWRMVVCGVEKGNEGKECDGDSEDKLCMGDEGFMLDTCIGGCCAP